MSGAPAIRRYARMALALAMGILLLSACAGDGGTTTVEAEPVVVRAGVDHETATIRQSIRYRVEIEHDPEIAPQLQDPVRDGRLAGLEVGDQQVEQDERAGRGFEVHSIELRATRTGSYALPAPQVTYLDDDGNPQLVSGPEILIEVQSVLDENATDIRDVKAPVQTRRWWPVVAIVGAMVLLGLVAWWWLRGRNRRAEIPMRPPHEVALERLQALRRTDFPDLEALQGHHYELSQVVRTYIEAALGLNATDLTSEEICARAPRVVTLDARATEELHRFLSSTDGVKFAAVVPSPLEIETTWQRAVDFVETTRPPDEDSDDEATSGDDSAADAGPAPTAGLSSEASS